MRSVLLTLLIARDLHVKPSDVHIALKLSSAAEDGLHDGVGRWQICCGARSFFRQHLAAVGVEDG